jgi:hypothetical protein
MVLDGGWGSGKTEFCHKLMNLMSAQNETKQYAIYVDAFKADHVDEPLLTVLAAVIAKLPDESAKSKLRTAAIPVLKGGAKMFGKAVFSHIFKQDLDEISDVFKNAAQSAANTAIDATTEALLREQEDAEENLNLLRTALGALTAENPMTIFIDELDRCRPDYAVAMLETIKHVFEVDNVNFVLVTNTDQLRASIDHCYGQHDAQRYLDKFIAYSFSLPDIIPDNSNSPSNAALEHFKNSIQKNNKLSQLSLLNQSYLKLIEQIIGVNHVSLREIETLVLHIGIYVQLSNGSSSFNNRTPVDKLLVLLAIALFVMKPDIAKAIKRKALDADSLAAFLGVSQLPSFDGNSPYDIHLHVFAIIALEATCNRDKYIPTEEQALQVFKNTWGAFFQKPWDDPFLLVCERAIKALSLE